MTCAKPRVRCSKRACVRRLPPLIVQGLRHQFACRPSPRISVFPSLFRRRAMLDRKTEAEGPTVNWPRSDYSRVPYWLYHDPEIYELEQERIFKGPTWSLIGLEAEIPNPGDFRT